MVATLWLGLEAVEEFFPQDAAVDNVTTESDGNSHTNHNDDTSTTVATTEETVREETGIWHWRNHADRLVLVVDVAVLNDKVAVEVELFEDNQILATEVCGIEFKVHLEFATSFFWGEGELFFYEFAIDQEAVTSFFVHDGTFDGILLTWLEAVLDGVLDIGVFIER